MWSRLYNVLLDLFGLSEFFTDFTFILKIFVLIAIISFVSQNIQNKTLKLLLTIFMIYFVLIANWSVFGTMWIIYTIIGLGVSGIIVDTFFVLNEYDDHGKLKEHEQEKAQKAQMHGGFDQGQMPNFMPAHHREGEHHGGHERGRF